MSTINTNGIDANYPIPGQNNNTQGFRDNFALIKQNLTTAGTELTDLQNKVVLKSALANSALDNNMGNTLIANASVLQFRNTTYNLGNALVDNVLVNCSLGDVQYGNLAGNITLSFGSWIPTGTSGGVDLRLGRPNVHANYTVTLPSQAKFTDDAGWSLVENSNQASSLTTITFPYNVTQLNLKLTSVDCGSTIYVQPTNRSFQSTQIQTRTPPSTGQLGDTVGTVCVDPGTPQLNVTATTVTTNVLTTTSTTTLTPGVPVVFTGTSLTANIVIGTTYYVRNVVSTTTFTLASSSALSANIALTTASGAMYMHPVQYMYVAAQDFNSNYNVNPINISSTTSPNLITLGSFTYVANNNPIMFTGSSANLANAGLKTNKVYYVKNAWSGNSTITISEFRYNGVASNEYQSVNTVSSGNVNVDCVCYSGSDIFQRIPLTPF